MPKEQGIEHILIGLGRVSKYDNGAARKARSLLEWYYKHGELTTKQINFSRRLISHKPPPKKGNGEAYFLYAIDDGTNVKLGYSNSPKTRMKKLQTGSAHKLNLVWKYKVGNVKSDAVKAEKKLHRHCTKYKKRGEWFNNECMALVKQFNIKRKGP